MTVIGVYASEERLKGKCLLRIVSRENGGDKEIHVYQLRLVFNHDGIKDCVCRRFSADEAQFVLAELAEQKQIGLEEGAALVQDAYRMNCLFNTKPAAGFEPLKELLEIDTGNLDRWGVFQKICSPPSAGEATIFVLLRAVANMDLLLAKCFCAENVEEESALWIWEEQIVHWQVGPMNMKGLAVSGRKEFPPESVWTCRVGVYSKNARNQMVQRVYDTEWVQKERFCLRSYKLAAAAVLKADDPQNPENGRVFCSMYEFDPAQTNRIKNILDYLPEVFINGEMERGYLYKWLGEETEEKEWTPRRRVFCEILLLDRKLWVYSIHPGQLAKAEQWLGVHMGKRIRFTGKCRIQERALLNMAVAGNTEDIQPVQGVLARLDDMCSFLAEMESRKATRLSMGEDGLYWFCSGNEGISEYYICGNWVRIHVFQGDMPSQLRRLSGSLGCILYDSEYREQTPQNSQSYWNWYKSLRQAQTEAKGFRARGFIPDLRDLKSGLLHLAGR
jgi:hypothetical protein